MRAKKTKRTGWIIIVIIVFLCFGTYKLVPLIHLSDGKNHNVDVSYIDANLKDGVLTIIAKFDGNADFFEIGRDLIVSSDSTFTDILKMKKCTVGEGCYVYEFDASSLSEAEPVFIKPPVLYMPTEIPSVSAALLQGKVAVIKSTQESSFLSESDWFSIKSVSTEEISDGVFNIQIVIDAISKDLPRFPKFVYDDQQIGGISSLYFDSDDNFDYGEFSFSVNADSTESVEKMISEASLVISDALLRVGVDDMEISSSIKSIVVNDTK